LIAGEGLKFAAYLISRNFNGFAKRAGWLKALGPNCFPTGLKSAPAALWCLPEFVVFVVANFSA